MKLPREYLRKRAKQKLARKTVQVDGCHVWQGRRNPRGYGFLRLLEQQLAHRVSWIVEHGQIPGGLCVLHKCDNPPCVNPEHLFLGTVADNNRDRERKGRGVRFYGEDHPRSRLTNTQRADIVRRFRAGENGRSLAREYEVCPAVVYASAKQACGGANGTP